MRKNIYDQEFREELLEMMGQWAKLSLDIEQNSKAT